MKDFTEKLNQQLLRKVEKFEKKNGNLEQFIEKQLIKQLHTMNVSDVFFEPDLKGLINYEKEL